MEGVWPQLEGLLARRGGCTYLSHGTREFGATICLTSLAHWFLAPHPMCTSSSILRCAWWGCGVQHLPHVLEFSYFSTSLLGGWACPLCSLADCLGRLSPAGGTNSRTSLPQGQTVCLRGRASGSNYVSHSVLGSQGSSQPRGAGPDGGILTALTEEEAGGLPSQLWVVTALSELLRSAARQEMKWLTKAQGWRRGLYILCCIWFRIGALTAASQSRCQLCNWIPAPRHSVEQHALYSVCVEALVVFAG